MHNFRRSAIAGSLALATASLGMAGTDIFFTPLTQSAPVTLPDSVEETTAPFTVPAGVTQRKLTSMNEIEADISQSVVRAPGAGAIASMWDMVAFDRFGENVFIPHETPWGAGLSRYNIERDKNQVLFKGDGNGINGDWSRDYAAFDPATFTPMGSVLAGEEWSGEGRIMEVLNPYAPARHRITRELQSIPNVAHEGLMFSADGGTLYFVDEWQSGSIYKLKFSNPRRYDQGGQTFVLRVDAFNGNPAANYNEAINVGKARTGAATWVPITDAKGVKLTVSDPFRNGPTDDPRVNSATRGGRAAADEVHGTPYGRPEDVEITKLANGHSVLYFAATSENTIYAVEELAGLSATVRVFLNGTTPRNVGFDSTTGTLGSPDNLAQDALGNIYVIEDAPNTSATGGDTWFARDADNNGVAESLDHFLSVRVDGSEATGMIFNPAKPFNFVAAIQHPDSTGLSGGTGDALWSFSLRNVAAPARCATAEYTGNSGCRYLQSMRSVGQRDADEDEDDASDDAGND